MSGLVTRDHAAAVATPLPQACIPMEGSEPRMTRGKRRRLRRLRKRRRLACSDPDDGVDQQGSGTQITQSMSRRQRKRRRLACQDSDDGADQEECNGCEDMAPWGSKHDEVAPGNTADDAPGSSCSQKSSGALSGTSVPYYPEPLIDGGSQEMGDATWDYGGEHGGGGDGPGAGNGVEAEAASVGPTGEGGGARASAAGRDGEACATGPDAPAPDAQQGAGEQTNVPDVIDDVNWAQSTLDHTNAPDVIDGIDWAQRVLDLQQQLHATEEDVTAHRAAEQEDKVERKEAKGILARQLSEVKACATWLEQHKRELELRRQRHAKAEAEAGAALRRAVELRDLAKAGAEEVRGLQATADKLQKERVTARRSYSDALRRMRERSEAACNEDADGGTGGTQSCGAVRYQASDVVGNVDTVLHRCKCSFEAEQQFVHAFVGFAVRRAVVKGVERALKAAEARLAARRGSAKRLGEELARLRDEEAQWRERRARAEASAGELQKLVADMKVVKRAMREHLRTLMAKTERLRGDLAAAQAQEAEAERLRAEHAAAEAEEERLRAEHAAAQAGEAEVEGLRTEGAAELAEHALKQGSNAPLQPKARRELRRKLARICTGSWREAVKKLVKRLRRKLRRKLARRRLQLLQQRRG